MLKKGMIPIVMALFFIPLTQAARLDLTQYMAEIGQFLRSLLSNHYAVYFLVTILLYSLLFNLFQNLLEKTHLGGSNPKHMAGAMAALFTLVMAGGGYYVGSPSMIESIIAQNSFFPSILLAAILFDFFKKSIGWKWAILCAGFGLFFLGENLHNSRITFAGGLCIVIFLFAKFKSQLGLTTGSNLGSNFGGNNFFRRRNKNKGKNSKNIKNLENKENKLENKEASEFQEIRTLFNDLSQELKKQFQNENPLTNKNDIILTLNKLMENSKEFLKEVTTESNLLSAEVQELQVEGTDIENTINVETKERSGATDSNIKKDLNAEKSISNEQKNILKVTLEDAKKSVVETNSMEDTLKKIMTFVYDIKLQEGQISIGDKSQLRGIFEGINVNFDRVQRELTPLWHNLKQHHEQLKERRKLLKTFEKDQKEKNKIEQVQAKDENKAIKQFSAK